MFTLKINLSHLAPKVRKSASIVLLTEEGLEPTKLCYIGRRIKIHFPNSGGSWGKVIEYDVDKDLYELEFSVEVKIHYMSFEDVLAVFPKILFWQKSSCSPSAFSAIPCTCCSRCLLS